jgi:hypothetical protein
MRLAVRGLRIASRLQIRDTVPQCGTSLRDEPKNFTLPPDGTPG